MAILVMTCFGHKGNRHKGHQYDENQSPIASIIKDVLDVSEILIWTHQRQYLLNVK